MFRNSSVFAAAVVLAVPAFAQDPLFDGDEAWDPDELWDPEVVTPTGQPMRVSETPSATFVITGDEIRRSGATSLPEVLRRVPGLEVRWIGASDGQVSARGFALELANLVLVLIDGRSAFIDLFGSTAYDALPISLLDVDRIEVVLGPGASVYGSKALLATINIITRSGKDFPKLEARAGAGPRGNAESSVRYGHAEGPLYTGASVAVRRLSKFESTQEDALNSLIGNLTIGYHPSPDLEVSLQGGGVRGRTHAMADAGRVDPFRVRTGYIQLDGRKGLGGAGSPWGDINLRSFWKTGTIRSRSLTCSLPTSNTCPFALSYNTLSVEAAHRLHYEVLSLPMDLRWGGEARWNTFDSTVLSDDESDLLNVAGFISNELVLSHWRITGGVRLDHQTFTEFTVSPRASIVFSPVAGHQIRAAVNIGYNNPEPIRFFADFESVPGLRIIGSPELSPERVYYGELGYHGQLTDWLRGFLNVFAYRMTNYTSINPTNMLTTGEIPFVNNSPFDGFGGEIGINVVHGPHLSAYAHYALLWLVPGDEFPYRGENLGAARHKVNAGLSLQSPLGPYLSVDGQYFSASELDRVPSDPIGCAPDCLPFELTPMGAFVMIHGRAGYRHESGADISVGCTNLLDDGTQHFPGGEEPEQRWMLTLGYYP